jgi:8-oxo-dGTP diphosphatase
MKPFNIRVYGIWIHQNNILMSDERIGDFIFTKFPGGGLEFGEGTKDCIIREWKEELGIDINVKRHYYTTDFFQASAFHAKDQVISIYYLVEPISSVEIKTSTTKNNFHFEGQSEESFRWISLSALDTNEVDLPIDKVVVELLQKEFSSMPH